MGAGCAKDGVVEGVACESALQALIYAMHTEFIDSCSGRDRQIGEGGFSINIDGRLVKETDVIEYPRCLDGCKSVRMVR